MSNASRPAKRPEEAGERARVLTAALLSTGHILGLSQRELAAILGASEASVSRMAQGSRQLAVPGKEAEIATLLVRLYRSLDTLVGGSPEKARAWFRADNHHLGDVPARRVRGVEGLVGVVSYLDAMRGKL